MQLHICSPSDNGKLFKASRCGQIITLPVPDLVKKPELGIPINLCLSSGFGRNQQCHQWVIGVQWELGKFIYLIIK